MNPLELHPHWIEHARERAETPDDGEERLRRFMHEDSFAALIINPLVSRYGLTAEVLWEYVSSRSGGRSPDQAFYDALIKWDL